METDFKNTEANIKEKVARENLSTLLLMRPMNASLADGTRDTSTISRSSSSSSFFPTNSFLVTGCDSCCLASCC